MTAEMERSAQEEIVRREYLESRPKMMAVTVTQSAVFYVPDQSPQQACAEAIARWNADVEPAFYLDVQADCDAGESV